MSPIPFDGSSREVDVAACFEWLRQGWVMFTENPFVWICGVAPVLLFLPILFFGHVLAQMLIFVVLPLYGAGLFQLCRKQANAETPKIMDIFSGCKKGLLPLLIVGAFCATGIFGIPYLIFLIVKAGFFGGGVSGRIGGLGFAIGVAMMAALLTFLLSIPVIMATWFAPALVYFHEMQPVDAMKASFVAGVKNWQVMGVFGLILMVACFFAVLPIFFGLLLLLPIFCGAVYASYRDIFVGI